MNPAFSDFPIFSATDERTLNEFISALTAQRTDECLRTIASRLDNIDHVGAVQSRTALYHAALWDKGAVCAWLLDLGASPCSVDDAGLMPLHAAALAGNIDVTKLLLQRGRYSETQLSDALVRCGAGNCEGIAEICNLLLAKGADPQYAGFCGRTVSHCAAREGNVAVLELLRDIGASLDSADDYRLTPLHHACFTGQIDSVEYLLLCGVNARTPGPDGSFAIHIAARSRNADAVAALLQLDPSMVNAVDNDGNTPLHHAVLSGAQDVIAELVAYSCDPFIRNHADQRPVEICDNTPAEIAHTLRVAEDMCMVRRLSDQLSMDIEIQHPLIQQQQRQQQRRYSQRRNSQRRMSGMPTSLSQSAIRRLSFTPASAHQQLPSVADGMDIAHPAWAHGANVPPHQAHHEFASGRRMSSVTLDVSV